jgi:hypothetical protein
MPAEARGPQRSLTGILGEQDMDTRILVTLMMVLVAIISLFVFTTNNLFRVLEDAASSALMKFGLSFSMGAVLVAILLMIVSIAALSERRFKAILLLSTILYIPSVLHFSNIDPFFILGFPNDLSSFGSSLPDLVIFLNGVMIVGGYIFLRSYDQLVVLRNNLLTRGTSWNETIRAVRGNLAYILFLIAFCSIIVLFFAFFLSWSSGSFQGMTVLPLIALIVSIMIILILVYQLLSSRAPPTQVT